MGKRERERNQARRAAEAASAHGSDDDAAGADSGGASPLVTQVIHGRPLVDVGHCGDVDGDAVFVLTTENPNMIDEEDFGDDDDEDNDENDDDLEILEEIRDRIACEEGREWTEISATSESLTVACETCGVGGVGTGCLVRVIAWGLDGAEHHTTTWLPNVTLELLQRVPEGPT